MNGTPMPEAEQAPRDAADLPQTLSECHEVITQQAVQLSQLQEQVGVLQERLKLDSTNSSKPPSSNGPGQGNRAQRRASQRKRGAQPGHKGSARAMLDEEQVDQIIDCKPAEVCECGAAMEILADEPLRHQVFDVPQVKAQVHEYRR